MTALSMWYYLTYLDLILSDSNESFVFLHTYSSCTGHLLHPHPLSWRMSVSTNINICKHHCEMGLFIPIPLMLLAFPDCGFLNLTLDGLYHNCGENRKSSIPPLFIGPEVLTRQSEYFAEKFSTTSTLDGSFCPLSDFQSQDITELALRMVANAILHLDVFKPHGLSISICCSLTVFS